MADARPHVWDDLIDDEIRLIARDYAVRRGLGQRPALLCIDNYNAVFGDRREPFAQAIARFPSSCGPRAWDAIEPTQRLMAAARQAGIPVIHTTRDNATQSAASRVHATKRTRTYDNVEWESTFFEPLAPLPDELVIRKTRASAFYGTALAAHLVQMGIDTVIVCGESTSGCVRASVLEAQMHGYHVAVVEECVFDRNWLSHRVNLFDMNSKYADVMFLDETLAYIDSVTRAAAPDLAAAR